MSNAGSAKLGISTPQVLASLPYILIFQSPLLDFTRAAGRKFAPTSSLMFPPASRFVSLIVLPGVVFLFASCAEDNRYAAPQYLGGIYGAGATLTYAAQRLLTSRHSMAREFDRDAQAR